METHQGEDELMCEAEEVLNWLCDELDQKSKEITVQGDAVYQTIPLAEDFDGVFDELDELMSELRSLVREAKQRLKEARQKVAA
jgi:ElaB/YqjD/DUF883 family membrane-anchored ribosome-binding protein